MSVELIKTDCINTITELLELYKDNEYMIQRIKTHIFNYLPNILENEMKIHEERKNRNTYLSNEQQLFIQIFLNKNKYFYLPNNNFFYEYNGDKYLIIKEDDIIHKLLSSISKERVLLQWKHKTKTNIIKQIKERNLFCSIPETDTIQNVLNVLYPSFFYSKNSAKYFLTIIGDNILKKNQQLIFLVSQNMKQFLIELDNVGISSIGNNNTTHNFMTKYHENHNYENCRLIKINENFSNDVWRELLKKIGLDLLCVAAHYSKRYENSDKFIENKSDEELKNYSYYLKNSTPSSILEEFCNKYIIYTPDCNMEWKNLHFVWKQFLYTSQLPNIIYSNSLKNLLKEKYIFDEQLDSFIGITSKYLPIHSDFIKFWEKTMYSDANQLFDNEIEVDEIFSLFKLWIKQEKDGQFMTNKQISEENIIKILKHFYPGVEIIEDKYILNICSSLWCKVKDIKNFFCYMKEFIINEYKLPLISFDDTYNHYYKFCNNNSIKLIVSKRYFEKYLYYELSDHIVYEKFIETKCFLNIE
jgi:DNA-binding Xre family transcriptional regulator